MVVVMRIAFVTFEYPPFIIGGAGSYAEDLTNELVHIGIDVVVVTPAPFNEDVVVREGLRIKRIRMNRRFPLPIVQFWLRLPKVIRELEIEMKFDVIHINDYYSYAFFKKRLSRAKQVMTVHHLVVDAIRSNGTSLIRQMTRLSGEDNLINRTIETRSVRRCDKIIAVSEFTKKRLMAEYGVKESSIVVIGEAIDLSGYELSDVEAQGLREEFDIRGKKIILFVGRVADKRKGLDILLRAFSMLPEKDQCVLVVIGGGDQEGARKTISELGISSNVRFTGYLDTLKLKKMFCLCDVFVSPSRLEGFGLTILQAMAAGKPIVATDVGAITENVKDGVNGYVIRPNDEEALSKAISSVLSDPDKSGQMGELNAISVKARFSWEKVAKAFERFYTEING